MGLEERYSLLRSYGLRLISGLCRFSWSTVPSYPFLLTVARLTEAGVGELETPALCKLIKLTNLVESLGGKLEIVPAPKKGARWDPRLNSPFEFNLGCDWDKKIIYVADVKVTEATHESCHVLACTTPPHFWAGSGTLPGSWATP